MGDQEGSKAMTIYIVVCFVLAMGALVAYKQFNDQRTELSGDYVKLAGQFADISAAYSRNISKYYTMKRSGELDVVDKEYRDNTKSLLNTIANDLGIEAGTGDANRLIITPSDDEHDRLGYKEFHVEVKLLNVTQKEWTVFLHNARAKTYKYATIAEVDVQRENQKFDRMSIVDNADADRALWNVTVDFVWFEEMATSSR